MWALVALSAAGCGRFGFEQSINLDADGGTSIDAATDALSGDKFAFGQRDVDSDGMAFDTTIKDYDPDINFDGAGFLGNQEPETGDVTPGLLRFDLAALSGRTVLAASLELEVHVDLNATFAGETIRLFQVESSWGADEATYLQREAGIAWSEPGARGADRGSELAAVTTTTSANSVTFDIAASVVQGWVDNPDTNNGVLLSNRGPAGTWSASSNYPEPSARPLLTVVAESEL